MELSAIHKHSIAKKKSATDLLFTAFYIGLLSSTYLGIGEEFILICGIIASFSMLHHGKIRMIHARIWSAFVGYYFFTTLFGMGLGFVEVKDILEFIIQYPIMIFVLSCIIRNTNNIEKSMDYFKKALLISYIYGLIEAVLKHNFLPDLFSIHAMQRIATMNLLVHRYQVSSFFLHYSYFGYVILAGMAINMIYPFRKKWLNIVFVGLSVIDLFFSKSRMSLLGLLILFIYDLYSKNKITTKGLRRFLFGLGIASLSVVVFWDKINVLVDSIYRSFHVVFEMGFDYGSLGQRLGTLLNVPRYIIENPFRGLIGTGFNSINRAFLDNYSYYTGYGIADNQLTTMLIEVGIIGTIIAIVGICTFFRRNKKKRSLSRYMVIIAMFAGITLDLIGTIYISALVLFPFCFYFGYEKKQNVAIKKI